MDAAVKVDSNVTIKVLESNKIVQQVKVHNKATVQMVQGLLEFLSGSFTPTSTNPQTGTTNPEEISSYVPVRLSLGNVGVKMTDRNTSQPKLIGINSSDFKIPTFDDYKLQNDITDRYTQITGQTITFDTVSITNFDDPNNSMGLLLQTRIPAGQLVGIGEEGDRTYFIDNTEGIGSGNGWVYYNPSNNRYEALFTELGLVSNTGALLARVLLDGEITVSSEGEITPDNNLSNINPLIQSDTTSLVVEWRIGIISLGQNDYVLSAANTVPQPIDLSVVSEENLNKYRYDAYVAGILYQIVVPDGIETIREYCFYNQTNATTVVIPTSVTIIKSNAFYGCESIETVYYQGTQEEWQSSVEIEEEGNSYLTSADFVYLGESQESDN